MLGAVEWRQVMIVTLSRDSWVATSSRNFCPELQDLFKKGSRYMGSRDDVEVVGLPLRCSYSLKEIVMMFINIMSNLLRWFNLHPVWF